MCCTPQMRTLTSWQEPWRLEDCMTTMRWINNVDTEMMMNLTRAWRHPRAKCWGAGRHFPVSPVPTGEAPRPSLVLRVDTPGWGGHPLELREPLPFSAWLFVTRRHISQAPLTGGSWQDSAPGRSRREAESRWEGEGRAVAWPPGAGDSPSSLCAPALRLSCSLHNRWGFHPYVTRTSDALR